MSSPFNKNFVRTEVPTKPISDELELSQAGPADKAMSFAYQDGLGRPTQSVAVGAGVGFSDVYSFKVYDPATGREEKQYMPYIEETSGGGQFKEDIETATHFFYEDELGDTHPYSTVNFKSIGSNEIKSVSGVGEKWNVANRKQKFDNFFYDGTGIANGAIKKYIIVDNTLMGQEVPVSNEEYGENEIFISESLNEDGLKSQTMTDLRGRKIGIRIWFEDENRWVTTYTVYDVLGRVRFVIPPNVAGQTSFSETEIKELLFQTEYNERGLVTRSRTPGMAGWNLAVYDRFDRLVLSQDPVQKVSNSWSFVKFDDLNREILTGEIQYSGKSHDDLITDAKNSTLLRYETRTPTSLGFSVNQAFPIVSEADVFSVVYFDDYEFINYSNWDEELSSEIYAYDNTVQGLTIPGNEHTKILGSITGSKVRILGEDIWLNTVVYYDKYGQAIQIIGEHHLRGYDRLSNQVDYAGNLVASKLDHYLGLGSNVSLELEILSDYSYDHMGRPLLTYHTINDQDPILISELTYNVFGEVIQKNIHSMDDGVTFLQSVDYNFNIRGWLDQINSPDLENDSSEDHDDLFGAKYHYTDDVTVGDNTLSGRYDGSLTAIEYGTGGESPSQTMVGYEYDGLNRLNNSYYAQGTDGTFNTKAGHFNTDYSYDDNGNIKTLSRKEDDTPIDNLGYTYSASDKGNQLLGVTDASNSEEGFDEEYGAPDAFDYNENGDMKGDAHKGIDIEYNQLNLISKVMFSDNTELRFRYDAAGNKLSKGYFPSSNQNADPIWRVDIIGGIEYAGREDANGVFTTEIRHAYTDEGRAIKIEDDYFYEYSLTDHQGNNRVTFGWMPYQKIYRATMEPGGDGDFSIPDAIRSSDIENDTNNNHTLPGEFSAALNAGQGRIIGPALTIPVKTGDHVEMEIWAKYSGTDWNANAASGLANALVGLLSGSPAGLTGEANLALTNTLDPGTALGLFSESASTTEPDAYLQYIFFDMNHDFVKAGFAGVTPAGGTGNHERLTIDGGFDATVDGFLYIYVANETALNQEVYFDDLRILHESDEQSLVVLQTNEYYPFGMQTSNSWEDEAYAYLDASALYQSLFSEYDTLTGTHDFLLRNYDAVLGRWLQTDPYQQYDSPYLGMGNYPHMGTDEDGGFFNQIAGVLLGGYIAGASSSGSLNPGDWNNQDWRWAIGGGVAGFFAAQAFVAGKYGADFGKGGGTFGKRTTSFWDQTRGNIGALFSDGGTVNGSKWLHRLSRHSAHPHNLVGKPISRYPVTKTFPQAPNVSKIKLPLLTPTITNRLFPAPNFTYPVPPPRNITSSIFNRNSSQLASSPNANAIIEQAVSDLQNNPNLVLRIFSDTNEVIDLSDGVNRQLTDRADGTVYRETSPNGYTPFLLRRSTSIRQAILNRLPSGFDHTRVKPRSGRTGTRKRIRLRYSTN